MSKESKYPYHFPKETLEHQYLEILQVDWGKKKQPKENQTGKQLGPFFLLFCFVATRLLIVWILP